MKLYVRKRSDQTIVDELDITDMAPLKVYMAIAALQRKIQEYTRAAGREVEEYFLDDSESKAIRKRWAMEALQGLQHSSQVQEPLQEPPREPSQVVGTIPELVQSIAVWVATNAERESVFLTPDPRWEVDAYDLLYHVSAVSGVSEEQIGEWVDGARAHVPK